MSDLKIVGIGLFRHCDTWTRLGEVLLDIDKSIDSIVDLEVKTCAIEMCTCRSILDIIAPVINHSAGNNSVSKVQFGKCTFLQCVKLSKR